MRSSKSAVYGWLTAACGAFSTVLVSLSGAAYAGTLSFNDALSLAVRETPALTANAAQVDVARAAAIPAGELPDPKLLLAVDNLPINTDDRFSLTRDSQTARRIGIMQESPNQDKRAARVAVAQGQVAMAEAQT